MADKVIVIDDELQKVLDEYRRQQKEIPSKRQAVKDLILKGWEGYKNE